MINCGHACPYNTLTGCKVKEYDGICPLSNMASTPRPKTNADKIRAMSDRELANLLATKFADLQVDANGLQMTATQLSVLQHTWFRAWMQWLQQPAEIPGEDC